MERMIMKIKDGEIAEIYEYEDSFIVGKILHSTKEYLYIHNVSIDGTFQGYALIALKKVNKILYNTKYLTFFNKVLKNNLDSCKTVFEKPYDLINECFSNNHYVRVSKFMWGTYVEDLKITSIHDEYFTGRRINNYGELKKEISIKYTDVSYLLFGTDLLRNYYIFNESSD